MPLIPFPDIPAFPGVPQLPRLPTSIGDIINLPQLPAIPGIPALIRTGIGQVQSLLSSSFLTGISWGVFDKDGKPLADPSQFTGIAGLALNTFGFGATLSTGSVDYSKETKVSDFPVERGSFASYNKVEMPAEPIVSLCMGGSEADRTSFLNSIDKASKSTELYSVVTPEVAYADYNITRYNYSRRSDKGATLLIVELYLKEIRQVSAQFTQSNKGNIGICKDPGATPPVDNGKVQAATPNISTLKSIADKIPSLADTAKGYLQGLLK